MYVCAEFGGDCVMIDFVLVVVLDVVVVNLGSICCCCVYINYGDLLVPRWMMLCV